MAALRAQFKQGLHAKTAEGAVGMVVNDASAEGRIANMAVLRLASGSETSWMKIDTLSECTEEEVSHYNDTASGGGEQVPMAALLCAGTWSRNAPPVVDKALEKLRLAQITESSPTELVSRANQSPRLKLGWQH